MCLSRSGTQAGRGACEISKSEAGRAGPPERKRSRRSRSCGRTETYHSTSFSSGVPDQPERAMGTMVDGGTPIVADLRDKVGFLHVGDTMALTV